MHNPFLETKADTSFDDDFDIMSSPDESESSDTGSLSVSDREALLWFTAAKADDETTMMDIFNRRPELLNSTDQHLGMTALHWAIDSGCDRVVQFLISKGVDVNAVDPEGNTPLHFAAYCHRQAAAELLISKGADRMVRNSDGQTAAEACDEPTLQAILMPPLL
ncbi:ankyrin repeat protein [Ostertagia ostertagi]